MTATALRGQHSPQPGQAPRDASRDDKLAQSAGELCPDELRALQAFHEAGVYISPSRLHAMYRRVMASTDADWDFGAHVLTYLSRNRRGSIPVDGAVGERAIKRLSKGLR